jgi:seryl-tRNA synthetase
MLDIKYLREHADEVRKNLETRKNVEYLNLLEEVLRLDADWRTLKAEDDELRKQRNNISSQIQKAVKAKEDISELKKQAATIPKQVQASTEKRQDVEREIRKKLMRIPNLLHESVPFGIDDQKNVEVKKIGVAKAKSFPLPTHTEWCETHDQADFERARKISGAGWAIIKGKLAQLDLALQRFVIDKLIAKGFTLVIPPHMMKKEAYEGVTDLADFEDVMYKIDSNDHYLIATSEHPIAGMYMNEVIDESKLPMKLVGLSHCFRREVGSHGVDEKGLFRMHQFTKVEQFVFCKPEDSWKIHEELQANSEEVFAELGIPYHVVNICTGDIGIVAAKKYDIEAWFPREEKYKEVTSCSNCTAYQAVRLNIRYEEKGKRDYLHTLNGTGIATSRALRAIIENFQNPDGSVTIPEVLRKYTGFDKIE